MVRRRRDVYKRQVVKDAAAKTACKGDVGGDAFAARMLNPEQAVGKAVEIPIKLSLIHI